MDTRTATAELGWTAYPTSGVSLTEAEMTRMQLVCFHYLSSTVSPSLTLSLSLPFSPTHSLSPTLSPAFSLSLTHAHTGTDILAQLLLPLVFHTHL